MLNIFKCSTNLKCTFLLCLWQHITHWSLLGFFGTFPNFWIGQGTFLGTLVDFTVIGTGTWLPHMCSHKLPTISSLRDGSYSKGKFPLETNHVMHYADVLSLQGWSLSHGSWALYTAGEYTVIHALHPWGHRRGNIVPWLPAILGIFSRASARKRR